MEKNKAGAESTIYESLKRLKGYVELKREEPFPKIKGKNKKYFGLTFRGLILALKNDAIKPKEAFKIRESHNIELPVSPMFGSHVINIEKDFPDDFYKWFVLGDIEEIPEDSLPFFTSALAVWALFIRFDYNPDSIRNYLKKKNTRDFGDLELLTSLAPMLKPFQHLMKKRFKEKEQKRFEP